MHITLNLERLGPLENINNLSIQQKRTFAWDIIDEHTPSKGFSRKKLVPLHSAIMLILSAPGSPEELKRNIEKVLNEPEPLRR